MHVTESIVHFRNINYCNFKAALISVFTLLLYFFPLSVPLILIFSSTQLFTLKRLTNSLYFTYPAPHSSLTKLGSECNPLKHHLFILLQSQTTPKRSQCSLVALWFKLLLIWIQEAKQKKILWLNYLLFKYSLHTVYYPRITDNQLPFDPDVKLELFWLVKWPNQVRWTGKVGIHSLFCLWWHTIKNTQNIYLRLPIKAENFQMRKERGF